MCFELPVEAYRDPEDGYITMRMHWADDAGDEGVLPFWLRKAQQVDEGGRSYHVWRQKSSPLEPVARVDGFEPILLGRGANDFGGLRGSKGQRFHICHATAGYTKRGKKRDALFVLGQFEMNEFKGLTCWESSARGTVKTVELFMLDPYSEASRNLRDRRAAAKAAPPSANKKALLTRGESKAIGLNTTQRIGIKRGLWIREQVHNIKVSMQQQFEVLAASDYRYDAPDEIKAVDEASVKTLDASEASVVVTDGGLETLAEVSQEVIA